MTRNDAIGRPDVLLDQARSWHVRWSHDGRPTVVVEHDPVIATVRTRARTILWFHLGGRPVEVERTTTALRFAGRRRSEYRATVAWLERLATPRGDDEQERPVGTRDERLGAQVEPRLLLLLRWRERRARGQPQGLHARLDDAEVP